MTCRASKDEWLTRPESWCKIVYVLYAHVCGDIHKYVYILRSETGQVSSQSLSDLLIWCRVSPPSHSSRFCSFLHLCFLFTKLATSKYQSLMLTVLELWTCGKDVWFVVWLLVSELKFMIMQQALLTTEPGCKAVWNPTFYMCYSNS